ncbi:hypothetical protein KAI65_04250 [Candidatus Parcubacteria bacterium]|nr:hypothetical protein [Candidatus Parcubacteria bacterium]
MYFLDTNSIIYYFKGAKKMVDFFDLLEGCNEEINLSVIAKIELLSFEKKNEINKIKKLLDNSNIFFLNDEKV